MIKNSQTPAQALRNTITSAYRMDETACLDFLLGEASLPQNTLTKIDAIARKLVITTRENKKKLGKMDTLLHQYDLSTDEGIALMCLAEALLRIPDKLTMDKFISDKLSTVSWKNHLSRDNAFFVNAATWSLFLTGKIYQPILQQSNNLWDALKRVGTRLGIPVIRPIIFKMMKAMGKQFVIGETIEQALQNSNDLGEKEYLFSYDMLGEAARTKADAEYYYLAYLHAIEMVGKTAKANQLADNPGISIKLSALHPRYEYSQVETIVPIVSAQVLTLAQRAKQYNISLVIDAEEADRLDISLDIFEQVFQDKSLADWSGLGIALQAYQKRAYFVLDWLIALSKQHQKRIVVRLVKGAYWDAEIKQAQVQGLTDYPVFTRKNATDVSFLACAKKMLANDDCFYSQFGTHNAYSIAAILEMSGAQSFEFQGLFGMSRPVYDHMVNSPHHPRIRLYAPVGTHGNLLGYLVRRLLENGANTSFLNILSDDTIPINRIVRDPVARIQALPNKRHPRIPLPRDIYGFWQNSQGIDLANRAEFSYLNEQLRIPKEGWRATSIINGKDIIGKETRATTAPHDKELVLGKVSSADHETIELAIQSAWEAKASWASVPVEERARTLERAAELLQANLSKLVCLLTFEGGRYLSDAIYEVREAIEFCRYYAYRARIDLAEVTLPGPTGELNTYALHPRGLVASISPWNFPLAIFTGQIVAALVTGNTVIAKPAEQTPLIAYQAIKLLHEAGVPGNVLHLLIGPGSQVGASLVKDERIAGIMFTGSTETAKSIERTLANRSGPIAFFIAETGGQNAMVVDSSILPEQTLIDIIQSAFNSAGQRCSALRVLFVQEEIAERLLNLISGYLQVLNVGAPNLLHTDVGPVIDGGALQMLQTHFDFLKEHGTLIAQASLPKAHQGYFFAPCAFEIPSLKLLKREVFGPILHVLRYQSLQLPDVMKSIADTGYGLTLGIQSRIDATINEIANRMPVGNMYVNRNMIGAVVGVQPFGGERLSGTGPKAGGPFYLPRLCVERSISNNLTAVGGNARLVSLFEDDDATS